ncbi:MAG: hypothetical protein ABI870_09195 [Rhodanobacter sp.]
MSAHISRKSVLAFNASYELTPDVSANDMAIDAGNILDSLISTVNTLAIEIGDEGSHLHANPAAAGKMLWGVMFQLQIAHDLVGAIEGKTIEVLSQPAQAIS